MNPHTDFPAKELTPWYPKSINPVRPGVYRTSITEGIGNSYNLWNGQYWTSFGNWGDYSAFARMIWRGLVRKHNKLPDNHSLATNDL